MASISNRYMLVSWDPVVINKAYKNVQHKKNKQKNRGFHDPFVFFLKMKECHGMSPLKRNHLTKGYFSNLTFSIQTHRIHVCIFTYIWLMFMVNVGKYTIHGSYGKHYPFAPCTEYLPIFTMNSRQMWVNSSYMEHLWAICLSLHAP